MMIKIKKLLLVLLIPSILGVFTAYANEIENTIEEGVVFKLVDEIIPDIYCGRYPEEYDHDSIRLQTIVLQEEITGSWSLEHEIVFSLPEGVKLRGAEINTTGIMKEAAGSFRLINDGNHNTYTAWRTSFWQIDDHTITGMNLVRDGSKKIEITLTLWVSVSLDYQGDIFISVNNHEMEMSALCGTAMYPISVNATQNTRWKLSMGLNGSIRITEKEAGLIPATKSTASNDAYPLENYLIIGLENIYFDSVHAEVVEGDLQIGDIYYKSGSGIFGLDFMDGLILIEILEESTVPSTIHITKIYTSVMKMPTGSFPLRIGGNIVQNSKSSNDSLYATFDMDYIAVHDYLFDLVYLSEVKVEVTNGVNTMRIGDKEYELSTAPYIENGTLMVPAEEFLMHLNSICVGGFSLPASETHDVIIIHSPKRFTTLYIGSNEMISHGEPEYISAAPTMLDGTLYIPFNAIGIIYDVPVSWDVETMTASFN